MKKNKSDRSNLEELRRKAEEQAKFENPLPEENSSGETQKLIHELQVHQIELEIQNEELRQAQELLEESRSLYIDLYDFAPIGYLTIDEHGIIKKVNFTASRLLQVEITQLIDRHFINFMVMEDRGAFLRHLKLVLNLRERQTIELRLKKSDEQEFFIRLESAFYQDAAGRSKSIRATFTDITARKGAEEAFKKLVVNAPIGILIVQNGKIKLINPGLQTITGYREDELLGRDSSGFVAPEFKRPCPGRCYSQVKWIDFQCRLNFR